MSAMLIEQEDAAAETPAGGATWRPSPYVLLRLAGKPYAELSRLKFTRTVEQFEHIIMLRGHLKAQKESLLELLFAEIGRHDGELRGGLVALKRGVYNERPPDSAARRFLRREGVEPTLRALVITYCWRLRQLTRSERRARALFDEELGRKRELLRQSCADAEFQKALQVASPTLSAGARTYAGTRGGAMRARDRQVEAGLFQYLARMTAKTSPFGRFGPVARGRADMRLEEALRIRRAGAHRRTTAGLNLGVVRRVARSLAAAPDLIAHTLVRVNDSLCAQGDDLVYMLSADSWDDTVTSERAAWRRLKASPAVRSALNLIRGQREPRTLADIISLHGAVLGVADEEGRRKVESFWRGLIKSGVIVCGWGLPSNSGGRLRLLRERAAALRTPLTEELVAGLDRLLDAERRFAGAAVEERQALLDESAEALARLTRWSPPRQSWGGEPASPFMEDTTCGALGFTLGQRFFDPFLEDLSGLLDCVQARDAGGREHALLLDVFTSEFGQGGRCADLLRFAAGYTGRAAALLRGTLAEGQPASDAPRFTRAMRRLGDYEQALASAVAAGEASRECALDPNLLSGLAREFGRGPEGPASMAMNLQVAAEDEAAVERGDFLVVLNYTLPGFGHFYSRYAALFDESGEEGPALFDEIKHHYERLLGGGGEPVEILSVLDNNAQLHPPFTARHIVAPGEVSDFPAERRLDPAALEVAHDAAADRLVVSAAAADGQGRQPLLPIYMGFFHLFALPILHRVLVSLSPTGHQMELLRPSELRRSARQAHGQDAAAAQTIRRFPRVRLGRFVLDRERWEVPAAALPPAAARQDEFALFLSTYAWARAAGLPEEVFVRVRRGGPSTETMRDAHKPLPVDFGNYFSVRMLLNLLGDGGAAGLEVEEMLPGPRQHFFTLGGEPYAAEFQIQFDKERDGHARPLA